MQRGDVFFAAVPYLPQAPLKFFLEDMDEGGNRTGSGRVEAHSPDLLRGKKKNEEYHVVLPVKARMVVIISPVGRLWGLPAAVAVPIYKISLADLEKSITKRRLVEGDKFREVLLLKKRYGLELDSYASITDVKLIHESMFTGKAVWSLSETEMREVDIRLSECLTGSFTMACQTCDRQCETCEILIAVNQLKR